MEKVITNYLRISTESKLWSKTVIDYGIQCISIFYSKLRLSAMKNSGFITDQILWSILVLNIYKLWAAFDKVEPSTMPLGYFNQTSHIFPYRVYLLALLYWIFLLNNIIPRSPELDPTLIFSSLFTLSPWGSSYVSIISNTINTLLTLKCMSLPDASSELYAGISSCQYDISTRLYSNSL